MKTLYIIRGASGSGKSTIAGYLINALDNSISISADDYFDTDSGYKFDSIKLPAAHSYSQGCVTSAMHQGYNNIIVHNTFTRQWELQPYRDLAAQYGYTVFEIICNNKFQNVHNVPADAVNKQRERFEYKSLCKSNN
jgi:predicted kinase